MAKNTKTAEEWLADAEDFADDEQYPKALACFQSAWQALPEPRDKQDLAVAILGGIADCQFLLGQWDECRQSVQEAFRCGAELDDTFLRLRLGQSLYELGNQEEAANWLVPVYLSEGREPFAAEDPKYLEFFRSKLEPPAGGWPKGW
jgi:tetratricopeptide (TPR) repeat protein